MLETIKEYLVSLGFAVDKGSFDQATKAMDSAGESVSKFAGSAVKKFAIAAVAVEGFFAATTFGIAKLLGGLAQADLANEKLARQMWISKDAAASYNNTLKAMGVTLQDLYLSPELMRNFQILREQANEMHAPEEYADQMKMIRSIQFEFQRMKLEATYALQWIGYYFIKYMGGPIKDIKSTLSDINSNITKTMPTWTKTIAQVMSWFARMGVTGVRALKDLMRIIDEVGDDIPRNIKLIAGALTILGTILATGPIGIISSLLIGLILLLDDFYTYLDGGDSQFGSFWEQLQKVSDKFGGISGIVDKLKRGVKDFYDELVDNGTIDNFKETFQNAFGVLKDLLRLAKNWVGDLYEKIQSSGAVTDLAKSLSDAAKSASDLIKTILGFDKTEDTLNGVGSILNNVIIVALQTISDLLEGIAGYIDTVKSVLDWTLPTKLKDSGDAAAQRLENNPKAKKGFWGDILESAKEIFTNDSTFGDRVRRTLGLGFGSDQGAPSYIYPQPNSQNQTNNFTMNQTNNIQGNDPQAIARAIQDNTAYNLRNFSGVIR